MTGSPAKFEGVKEGLYVHPIAVVKDCHFGNSSLSPCPYSLRCFHAEEVNLSSIRLYRVVDEFGNGIGGVVIPTIS